MRVQSQKVGILALWVKKSVTRLDPEMFLGLYTNLVLVPLDGNRRFREKLGSISSHFDLKSRCDGPIMLKKPAY